MRHFFALFTLLAILESNAFASPIIALASLAQDSLSPIDSFVFISGGTFDMGDVMDDREQYDEVLRRVRIDGYHIGRYEVTFEEYDFYCKAAGREKPSDNGFGRGSYPVINISWYDAIEYCNWLSGQKDLTPYYTIDKMVKDTNCLLNNDTIRWSIRLNEDANGYRLPTEAEWEYAARQKGQIIRFGNGENIATPRLINFDASKPHKHSSTGVNRKGPVPVGSLGHPNKLGLYDMSGNVFEWCWDWYENYPPSNQINPKGPQKGTERVIRGGCWAFGAGYARASYRHNWFQTQGDSTVGFRLARN